MQGVIADADFLGHFERLLAVVQSEEWLPYWDSLRLQVFDFAALGLKHDTRDRIVWNRCQERDLVLITGNRNDDGPDSLESTIREAISLSLPVFTVGDAQRVLEDASYARAVAVDLLDYLFTLRERPERLLGIGRIYLPKNAV